MKVEKVRRSKTDKNFKSENVIEFNVSGENQVKLINSYYGSIYKDLKFALVREWLANAWDAHVEAGISNRPIKVSLPCLDNSEFTVTSYGIGLDFERLKIVSSYGESSKISSDTQTGGFGIGLKVAYGYENVFTITTVVDKVKHFYLCEISEEYPIGAILHLASEDCEEEDYTSFSINVRQEDHEFFDDAYTYITKFWDVRPQVNKEDQNDIFLIYTDDKVSIFLNRKANRRRRETIVRVGAISYGLSSDFWSDRGYFGWADETDIQIVQKVSPNKFSVTQSRDSLNAKHTSCTETFNTESKGICLLVDLFNRKIKGCTNHWECLEKIVELIVPENWNWNAKLGNKHDLIQCIRLRTPSSDLDFFVRFVADTIRNRPLNYEVDGEAIKFYLLTDGSQTHGHGLNVSNSDWPWYGLCFLYDVEKRISRGRIRAAIKEANYFDRLANRMETMNYEGKAYKAIPKKDNALDQKFLKENGYNIVFLSEIYDLYFKREIIGSKGKNTRVLSQIDTNRGETVHSFSDSFVKSHVDVTTDFLWMDKNKIQGRTTMDFNSYGMIKLLLSVSRISNKPIYVLDKKQINSIKPKPDNEIIHIIKNTPDRLGCEFSDLFRKVSFTRLRLSLSRCTSEEDLFSEDLIKKSNLIKKLSEQVTESFKEECCRILRSNFMVASRPGWKVEENPVSEDVRTIWFSIKKLTKLQHPVYVHLVNQLNEQFPLYQNFLTSDDEKIRLYAKEYALRIIESKSSSKQRSIRNSK